MLTNEDMQDDLHDMCCEFLFASKYGINNGGKFTLRKDDILEWEYEIIEERDIHDPTYEATIFDINYFYKEIA